MCENVEKCVKMCWRPVFYILLIDLNGYFLTVCIYRNFSSFICITPDMLKEYPNGNLNAVRIIIEINGERIDEIHKLPFCRAMAIRKRRSLTTVI